MYIPYINKKNINKQSFVPNLEICLILHNVQVARNVAEIFNLAYAYRSSKLILSGSTTTPPFGKDLKFVSDNSEKTIKWIKTDSIISELQRLKKSGFVIASPVYKEGFQSIYDIDFKNYKDKVQKLTKLADNWNKIFGSIIYEKF